MEKIDNLIEQAKQLFCKSKYNEALNIFKNALDLDNSRADICFEIGKIYFINLNYKEAKVYLEKAISLDIKQIYAYDLLIKLYDTNKDILSFEKMFNKLKSFFNNKDYLANIDLLIIMFTIAKYIDRYDDIMGIIRTNIRYINNVPKEYIDKFILLIGDIYEKKKNIKKSLIYKYKYFLLYSNNIEIVLKITKEYILLNKISQAYKILKSSLINEINKNDYDIWKHIIIVLDKFIDKQSIRDDLQLFYKIIPNEFVKFKNVILNELEIIDSKIDLQSKPRTMVVTLTSNCNIRCLMCKVHKYNWQLPDKTKNEIIKLMPYLESVVWLGGEVFLYKNFEELFNEACKNNVTQDIITNSMLLNEDIIIKLLKNNVNLAISVDGITKDVFEHIRCGAKFDKLIENLELIKFYRKKFNSQNHYRMNTLILKSNYKQIENFIDFAYKYGFNNLFIDCISTDLRTEENIFYYYRDDSAVEYINSVKQKIIDKARNYKIDFYSNIPSIEYLDCTKNPGKEPEGSVDWGYDIDFHKIKQIDLKEKYCLVPWKKLMLDKDGYVRPDCFCRKERAIGNVLTDSLFDIWNSDRIKMYRTVNVDRCFIDEVCQIACLKGKIDDVYRK